MNTTRKTRLQALSAATFMTLAMLLGVHTLAQKDSTPQQQMAQARHTPDAT